MPPRGNLRAFLRGETKRHTPYVAPKEPLLRPRKETLKKSGTQIGTIGSADGTDSLFGEDIHTNDSDNNKANSEVDEDRAPRSMTSSVGHKPPGLHNVYARAHSSTSVSKNAEIVALRNELETLVSEEEAASTKRELRWIVKEKEKIIFSIGKLERDEREAKVSKLKDPYYKPLQALPEPISPEEKKGLMRKAKLIAKARTSPITPSPKRRREADSDDDDLDGEDRLRLGIKKPRQELKTTGHWLSKIHSYMPESQVDTETFNNLNSLSEEQKIANRMDIMKYCKGVAKIDRINKKREERLGVRK